MKLTQNSVKKITMTTLTCMLVLGLTACGRSTPSASPASPSGNTGSTDKKKEIVLSHKSLNYYAFVAMQEAAKREAEKDGYAFESAVADFDSAKQTNQFMNFVSQKPAAIITDPNDSEGLVAAIDKANAAGIPVGVFDTPTTGGKVAFTIAFDNYKAGQMAAEEIVKRLEQKYGKAKGVVLNAYGAMSSSAWRARKDGFDAVMKKYPDITYLSMPAEGDMRKTQDVCANAIAKYGSLDAVHAPSDNPAMGLYEALKQTNHLKKVGEPGHVIFVTIDGEPIALQRIKEGWYDATVNQDCVAYGKIVIQMLNDYSIKGKDVPLGPYKSDEYYWKEAKIDKSVTGPNMVIDPYLIDKSNADDPKNWGNVAWNQYNIRY